MHDFWYDYVKSKYREKVNFMLLGYRQLYSLHKKQKTLTQTLQKLLKQDHELEYH